MADEENNSRRFGKAIRAQGVALAIPMVLLSFPLGAALIGKYLSEKFEQPWILPVMIVAGLALGLRECIRLLRKLNRMSK